MEMSEYIEREKAFDAVFWQFCASSDETEAALNAAIEEIRAIPAADVRPLVRAKWELDSDKLPICSNCGEIALQRIFVKVPHLIQDVRMVKSNFCPNCGADMREES
jgi:ribosomal protein L32